MKKVKKTKYFECTKCGFIIEYTFELQDDGFYLYIERCKDCRHQHVNLPKDLSE